MDQEKKLEQTENVIYEAFFFAYLHERSCLMQLKAATLKLMLWFWFRVKMEEDDSVCLNAHSSPTENLYPGWAGGSDSR